MWYYLLRQDLIDEYNNDTNILVFLLSTKAGKCVCVCVCAYTMSVWCTMCMYMCIVILYVSMWVWVLTSLVPRSSDGRGQFPLFVEDRLRY